MLLAACATDSKDQETINDDPCQGTWQTHACRLCAAYACSGPNLNMAKARGATEVDCENRLGPHVHVYLHHV